MEISRGGVNSLAFSPGSSGGRDCFKWNQECTGVRYNPWILPVPLEEDPVNVICLVSDCTSCCYFRGFTVVFMAIKRDKLTCDSVSQTITKPVFQGKYWNNECCFSPSQGFLSETMIVAVEDNRHTCAHEMRTSIKCTVEVVTFKKWSFASLAWEMSVF